jgi:hypothetical protein
MAKTTRYAARKVTQSEGARYGVEDTTTGEIVARFASISEASYHATSLNPAPTDPFEGLV